MQKFRASNPHKFRNGAVGWAPGGPFDCIGPYAKVQHCPVEWFVRDADGEPTRLPNGEFAKGKGSPRTVYATAHADTYFSMPACTRYRGQYVSGFISTGEDGPVFVACGGKGFASLTSDAAAAVSR